MPTMFVGFSRPRKWFVPISWLIRLVNGTPFSHTYIRMYSSSIDRYLVYEAHAQGLTFCGREYFEKNVVVLQEFPRQITEEQKKLILQFCVDHALEKYSVKQNFGILYVKFMLWAFGKNVKNPWPGGWNCVEVLARLAELIDVKIEKDPDSVDLNDIYQAYLVA